MAKKYPKFNDLTSLINLSLSSTKLSLLQTEPEVSNFLRAFTFTQQLTLERINREYGIRATELTVALMEKIKKLLLELFADPKSLKPLAEWGDFERNVFFIVTSKMLAAQTHDFKIFARIQARMKDIGSYAHEHPGYIAVLIGLTAVALLLTTLVIMSLLAAPLVAIPLVCLLGIVMKGLHAFMTINNTHSNKVTEDQEITEFCQALLEEINTFKKQMEDPTNESPEKAEYDSAVQQVKTQGTKTHGRFTLPLSFFNPEKRDYSDITTPVEDTSAKPH